MVNIILIVDMATLYADSAVTLQFVGVFYGKYLRLAELC